MREDIDLAKIDKLAMLSELSLSEDEKKSLVGEVSGIIDMLKGCDEVDTPENIAYARVVDVDCLREDIVLPSECRDTMLSSARNIEDGYVVSPKVVD